MICRPPYMNAYEFVVVAALRAQQLLAGCTPRLGGEHSATTMAQMEVVEGCVARCDSAPELGPIETPSVNPAGAPR